MVCFVRDYSGPLSVYLMIEGAHPKDGGEGEARAKRIWGRGGYVRCFELDHGWVVHSREMHRCRCSLQGAIDA